MPIEVSVEPDTARPGPNTPLYSAAAPRGRGDQAEISDEDKRLILCKNSLKLFGP